MGSTSLQSPLHHSHHPIEDLSPLYLPFGLWQRAPRHPVTSILLVPLDTPDAKAHVYTGSSTGHICRWSIYSSSDSSEIVPESMFFGHSSPVTAMCLCHSTKGRRSVLSASTEGTLAYWDVPDDHCRRREECVLSFWPTQMVELPGKGLVACSGRSHDIEIVSTATLTVVRTYLGHTSWIIGMWLGSFAGVGEVLATADVTGTVHKWEYGVEEAVPIGSTVLDTCGVSGTVSSSNNGERLCWVDMGRVCVWKRNEMEATLVGDWCNADFLNNNHVIVWSRTGDEWTVLSIRDGSLSPVIRNTVSSRARVMACLNGIVVHGDDSGRVIVWRAAECMSLDNGDCEAWVSGAVTDGFNKDDDVVMSAVWVCEPPMRLVEGRMGGLITVTAVPQDPSPLHLTGHTAAVTSLLLPELPDGVESRLLVSGSVDGVVRIWDLKQGISLHSFRENIAPVTLLFQPPVRSAFRRRACICASTDDHSISIYSLRDLKPVYLLNGHVAPVSRLVWGSADDYVIIQCSDGSTYVWRLSDGALERRATGQAARDMLSEGDERVRDKKAAVIWVSGSTMNGTDNGPFGPASIYSSDPRRNPLTVLQMDVRAMLQSIRKAPGQQVYWPLSYLLPWGMSSNLAGAPDVDAAVRSELGLLEPTLKLIPGVCGYGGTLSLLLPRAYGSPEWWLRSPRVSAIYSLSIVALAKALLATTEHKNACSLLITMTCALLPITAHGFRDPSPSLVVQFWQDTDEDVQQSARSVLGAAFDRMTPEQHHHIVEAWGPRLPSVLAVVILGILGSEHGNALDNVVCRRVAQALWKLLESGGMASTLSAELLGRGYLVWQPYIEDAIELIRRLFHLALNSPPGPSGAAHHALLLVGAAEPRRAVLALGDEIIRAGRTPLERTAALRHLRALVRKHSAPLTPQLPHLIDVAVRSIDPDVPSLRETCLETTTGLLHELVRRYTMVSFHQQSQRLAVGTPDGLVLIYDVRTATKWQVLEGHTGALSAVAFSRSGKLLASYSLSDGTLRVWQTGTTFFGILGSAGRCVHVMQVPKKRDVMECRIQWPEQNMVTLLRDKDAGVSYNV